MSLLKVILLGVLVRVTVTVAVDPNKFLSAKDAVPPPCQYDMILTPEQMNGVINATRRWSNKEIVFQLSNDFNITQKRFIRKSLKQQFAHKTCVTFRKRTPSDRDYVYVTGGHTGCNSFVGKKGGRQDLNLDPRGCLYSDNIAHEFLHAAGFYHQHSSHERDDWVTIECKNIKDGCAYAFKKLPDTHVSNFDEKYDYDSIMHYDPYAFSKNGKKTIVTLDPNAVIGVAKVLSEIDIKKLNKMYEC